MAATTIHGRVSRHLHHKGTFQKAGRTSNFVTQPAREKHLQNQDHPREGWRNFQLGSPAVVGVHYRFKFWSARLSIVVFRVLFFVDLILLVRGKIKP